MNKIKKERRDAEVKAMEDEVQSTAKLNYVNSTGKSLYTNPLLLFNLYSLVY
jgi:hypothetical protein